MKNSLSDELYELMYNKSKKEIVSFIKKCDSSIILHNIAVNLNWDDGFDIPKAIVNNDCCDIGTALMIFDNAEGYMMFFDEEWKELLGKNSEFISEMKKRIEKRDFKNSNIRYVPELSKTDVFKLKKYHPELDSLFIDGTDGKEIEIVVI